jgi:hypothetical protein
MKAGVLTPRRMATYAMWEICVKGGPGSPPDALKGKYTSEVNAANAIKSFQDSLHNKVINRGQKSRG